MTQNTQTTADRIFELMREIRLWDVEHDATDHRAVANTIAAEIDALTRERDEARIQIVALEASNAEQAQMMADGFADVKEQSARLAEARAEVERREADLATARITITELDSERNGANAFLDEVAHILQMPPAYMGGVNGWAGVKMSELAGARAEVERLRPAAEAWEAHEAHLYADKNARTYAETGEARANYVAAAARARAAKGQP